MALDEGNRRFAARRQVEIVWRLLRGEDLEWLSREPGDAPGFRWQAMLSRGRS